MVESLMKNCNNYVQFTIIVATNIFPLSRMPYPGSTGVTFIAIMKQWCLRPGIKFEEVDENAARFKHSSPSVYKISKMVKP